jgi:hypothetical protein
MPAIADCVEVVFQQPGRLKAKHQPGQESQKVILDFIRIIDLGYFRLLDEGRF